MDDMPASFRLGQLARLIGALVNRPTDAYDLPTTTLFRICIGRVLLVADTIAIVRFDFV